MAKRKIYITEFDLKRLNDLIVETYRVSDLDRDRLKELEKELEKGKVVKPEKVPANVITMNSKVRVRDLESNEEIVCTIVFPEHADIDMEKISILSPLGTALIGYKAGDTINWEMPSGIRDFTVEEILYQPEAAGNYLI